MPLKPRVGQFLYQADGKTVIGEITRVETGQNFSVTIQKSKTQFPTVITEFPKWKKRHGWIFKYPKEK